MYTHTHLGLKPEVGVANSRNRPDETSVATVSMFVVPPVAT